MHEKFQVVVDAMKKKEESRVTKEQLSIGLGKKR